MESTTCKELMGDWWVSEAVELSLFTDVTQNWLSGFANCPLVSSAKLTGQRYSIFFYMFFVHVFQVCFNWSLPSIICILPLAISSFSLMRGGWETLHRGATLWNHFSKLEAAEHQNTSGISWICWRWFVISPMRNPLRLGIIRRECVFYFFGVPQANPRFRRISKQKNSGSKLSANIWDMFKQIRMTFKLH